MSGWICSYRAVWSHPIFENDALRVGVWHWMLHKAVWKEKSFRNGKEIITLKRGQLCVSQRQICTETGMPHRKLRTFLNELTKEGAITQKTPQAATQGRTVITICKYEQYQASETTADTARDTQPTHGRHTKEQLNKLTIPSNEGDAALPPEAAPVDVSILSKAVWDAGKTYLASRGINNGGSMIGRWLKTSDPQSILGAIDKAQRSGTQDPVPYITQILNSQITGGRNEPSHKTDRLQRIVTAAAAGTSARDWG